MINILLDALPTTISVAGREFFADTDFRTIIELEELIMDPETTSRQMVNDGLALVFTKGRPRKTEEAWNALMTFYNCGKELNPAKVDRRASPGLIQDRIYDYEYDGPYIFAAFMSQYGIDLNAIKYLHWWKFQALFRGLDDKNKIVQIMGYRAADPSKIKDENERQRIANLQYIYRLPDQQTREEKAGTIGAVLAGAFR